jgi:hypothetical protein
MAKRIECERNRHNRQKELEKRLSVRFQSRLQAVCKLYDGRLQVGGNEENESQQTMK